MNNLHPCIMERGASDLQRAATRLLPTPTLVLQKPGQCVVAALADVVVAISVRGDRWSC